MSKIKSAVGETETWLCAKDVFTELGLTWDGHSSIKELTITDAKTARVPTQVGKHICKLNQIVLSKSGVEKVLKKHGLLRTYGSQATSWFIAPEIKPTKTTIYLPEDFDRLKKTVDELKVVVAQLLTQGHSGNKSLSLTGKSGSVSDGRTQAECRKAIRKVVENYAEKRANELNIVDPHNRSVFYDLTYKTLYTEYKAQTPKHIDLKVLAEQKTKTSGIKTSALQVAEQLGIANELLNLAKSLYGK